MEKSKEIQKIKKEQLDILEGILGLKASKRKKLIAQSRGINPDFLSMVEEIYKNSKIKILIQQIFPVFYEKANKEWFNSPLVLAFYEPNPLLAANDMLISLLKWAKKDLESEQRFIWEDLLRIEWALFFAKYDRSYAMRKNLVIKKIERVARGASKFRGGALVEVSSNILKHYPHLDTIENVCKTKKTSLAFFSPKSDGLVECRVIQKAIESKSI